MTAPTAPNGTLRAIRMGMLLSQDDFARAIRTAGERAGRPNDANKRLVQRWEAGTITSPRPTYARALEAVTGLPIGSLGFSLSLPATPNGHDQTDTVPTPAQPQPAITASTHPAAHGNRSGVWRSRYEYYSSGRDDSFVDLHYVVVLQHGDRLTVRSLPGSSDSELTMDLTVDGPVLTGTWVEQTAAQGYYRGARYYGAIQMLMEPTGHRMAGKWVGFGKDMEVNSGPWELTFETESTNKATMDRYNRPPTL